MSNPRSAWNPKAWAHARKVATQTPDARNRYVDFLRAASISVVLIGHWLMAAAFVDDGGLVLENLLAIAPWTQWMTWSFQVMPVFFIVGGYANAASWEAARRTHQPYAVWTAARLRRLIGPVVPLLVVWSAMAIVAYRFGVDPQMIKVGSQAALIPTWFLAVYLMIVLLAPVTHWAWRRFGMGSLWALFLAAVAVDSIAFSAEFGALRWINYVFVWLGVHQLGYAWRDGRFSTPGRSLALAAGGLGLLIFLVTGASYPVSMITVPGAEISNSRPPTLALFALAGFHGGLLLTVQNPVRKWLKRAGPWTATVLVNGTIMTVYLWHVTVMVLLIGLLNVTGRLGLGLVPASGAWWATRPIWIAILVICLTAFVGIFGHFEQTARGKTTALPVWRVTAGAVGMGAGLASLALHGIGAEGPLGIRIGTVSMALLGAALVLGPPLRRPPIERAADRPGEPDASRSPAGEGR